MAKRIIIAGAGIVGVAAAVWARRAGHDAVLVEREAPASATSHGNAGILAAGSLIPVTTPDLPGKLPRMLADPMSPLYIRYGYLPRLLPFLPAYLRHCTMKAVRGYAAAMAPLLGDSVDQHRALAEGSGAEGFITDSDYCHGYATHGDFEADAKWWELSREYGAVIELQDAATFGKDDALYRGQFETIVRIKNNGHITDPGAYIKTLAAHFVKTGGEIKIANITGIETSGGRITGLETDSGKITGDEYLLTTGIWSGGLMKKLGIRTPLESERGYHVEFINPSAMPKYPMMVEAGKFVITPMEGRIRCAGLVEFGGLAAGASASPIRMIKRRFAEIHPGITYDETREWLGHRPATADSRPLIGALRGFSNLHTGFGHQHLGLTAGAKTGRLLIDMIGGRTPNMDMRPFDPGRFG